MQGNHEGPWGDTTQKGRELPLTPQSLWFSPPPQPLYARGQGGLGVRASLRVQRLLIGSGLGSLWTVSPRPRRSPELTRERVCAHCHGARMLPPCASAELGAPHCSLAWLPPLLLSLPLKVSRATQGSSQNARGVL